MVQAKGHGDVCHVAGTLVAVTLQGRYEGRAEPTGGCRHGAIDHIPLTLRSSLHTLPHSQLAIMVPGPPPNAVGFAVQLGSLYQPLG